MNKPYFIQVDNNGCSKCGFGRTWTVIGPDGAASSCSYRDEEDAGAIADALNEAFEKGKSDRQVV